MAGNIIDIHLDAWKDRCQDIHGLYRKHDEYHLNKDDMLATIKVHYSESYILSYHDRKWFGRDINSFCQINE